MPPVLQRSEVAKHNSRDSCWVILYNKVYDVTEFLQEHPGGEVAILRLAGRDATVDFDSVHPSRTLEDNLPTSAFLGAVESSIEIEPSVSTKQAPAKTSAAMKLKTQPEPENVEMSLSELLNLSDIEKYGTSRLPKKSWAYFWSASDDMISKRWNTTAYQSIILRPRVFIDVQNVDTTTYLLGHRFDLPIFISPTAMCRLAHPSGEVGIAKSCAANNILQIISNNASQTPEEVAENTVEGQVLGWQLYVQTDASKSEAMMRRINTLRDQYQFLVLTLDAPAPGKREEDERQKNEATPLALQNLSGMSPRASTGLGKALFQGTSASLAWSTTLKWICQNTDLPIVLKGIQTHEDAILALSYAPQVQALILSNHGGRGCDTAPSAMHTLLEIRRHSPEVLARMEVWIDGGIQRGTDVVKALALGAKGVGLGRAALWSLAAGGTAGVDRMISILREEIETAMRLLGVTSIGQLNTSHVNTRALDAAIYHGDLDIHGLRSKL